MPTIGEALAEGERALFVGRAAELAVFERWLAADPRPPEVLEVSGPGGIGKSSLLAAFRGLAHAQGCPVVEVDLRDTAGQRAALLERLGGTDAESAAAHLNQVRPLVLLDTFEDARALQQVVGEELLPRLDTAVKLVIAGRFRLSHLWRAERPGRVAIRPLMLAGLGADDSRAYLERRGLTDATRIDQILHVVGGHPLGLSLAADLAVYSGVRNFGASPERHMLVRSLAEQLLRNLSDPHLRELIEACAVVEQFDQPTLEAIVGQQGTNAAFEQLCQLSVVRPAPHGLMLHDEVRRILADDLRWRHKERYSALRLRALACYRERMRTASAEDRAWLLAQRLYLWEHAFVQTMLFGEDDPGEVWVEPGTPEDEPDALEIEMIWHTQLMPALGIVHYEEDPEHDPAAHQADMAHLLALPGRRLRIARDQDGQALGFSLAVPVWTATADYLVNHRVYGPLLRAYFERFGWETLPSSPETSQIDYFLQATHKGVKPEAVTTALWRELFGLFEREGVVLITLALGVHKELFGTLGFERLPVEYPPIWGLEERTEAYMLVLQRIGLETWIEAIMAGRRPPRVLAPDELERALQDALLHWHDDAWLANSILSQSVAVARLAPRSKGAEAVREAIRQALQRARAAAPPDLALTYAALERAYLSRSGSHEQAAEELAVSRATFYRLLRRGIQALARVLQGA